jgi:F5/8 type C domain/Curlin associated repeat
MIRIFFAFLMLMCTNAFAAITDGKFGMAQIFDVQYYWSGNTLNASSFIAPYDQNWNHPTLSTGQYFKFFASTVSPGEWGLGIYNADGSRASVVHDTGTIDALGNGAIFYLGSGFFGNVITTTQGYSYGSSATFTNMNTNPTSTDLNNYTFASSTPLAAGQTATVTPTPDWRMIRTNSSPVVISNIYPTSYNSPSNEGATNAFDGNTGTKYLNFDKKNAGVTVRLSQGRVVQKFTVTTANDFSGRDPTSYKLYGSNDGVNWTLIKQDTLSLSETRYWTSPEIQTGNTTAYVYYFILFPTTKSGDGCGLNCNSMQISEVTYYYDLNDGVTSTDQAAGSTPSNPGTAGSVCSDCGPTVVGTSTSNSVSTSSTNTNTGSISVTRPTTTSNHTDVYVGTTTVTTTTTTPVTTTTWSDGSTTTSNGTSTTTSATTYTITPTYGEAPTYTRLAPNTSGNSIYVKQVYAGSNTSVTLEQDGNNNAITGTDSGWATVDGNNSAISVKQFGNTNIVGLKMNAWGNNIDIKQRTEAGGDVAYNILNLESAGNGNAVTAQQQADSNTASIKITYDINTVNVTQKGGSGNASYAIINGYWNTVNNTQNGYSNFSLINITGDNNTATVNQTGFEHSTLLNLIGNKNTVSVIQTGVGDTYSLQQTCTNPAGCSVSVIRNR